MRPDAAGLSNIDAMRRMIGQWLGMQEPVSFDGKRAPGGPGFYLIAPCQWPCTSPQVLGAVR